MQNHTPLPLGSTALVISRNRSLIEEVTSVNCSAHRLRFEVCETVEQASAHLDREDVVLALIHLTGSSDEVEVASLLSRPTARQPWAAVILSDVYEDHQAARLLRAGATDYLGLPLDHAKLACLIDILFTRACVSPSRVTMPPAPAIASRPESEVPQQLLLGPEMMDMMEQLRRVAPQETTLLLTGETGTGKTWLARLIHDLSPRRDEPFLVVDCGALCTSLIESELFGHVKGAFTGADRDRPGKLAAVGRGTLLLDEINSLPLPLQGKLLRAVDERLFEPVGANKPQPLHARLIAASNASLEEEVAAGRFRADLNYRLNVVAFYLPPLRERPGTVAPLARKFLAEFVARNRPDLCELTPEALDALECYPWPGNIRELRNVIERAAALCRGPDVLLSDLPEAIRRHPPGANGSTARRLIPVPKAAASPSLSESKEEAEVLRITQALRKHRNNRLRAAAELGMSRMGLYKKLHKYGLMGTG